MDEREREQHPPLAEPVDQPALDGAPMPLPAASEPATAPAIANEPVASRR